MRYETVIGLEVSRRARHRLQDLLLVREPLG